MLRRGFVVTLKCTKSFEQNSMYRGAMEPTWTSGVVPRVVGVLTGRLLGTGVGVAT